MNCSTTFVLGDSKYSHIEERSPISTDCKEAEILMKLMRDKFMPLSSIDIRSNGKRLHCGRSWDQTPLGQKIGPSMPLTRELFLELLSCQTGMKKINWEQKFREMRSEPIDEDVKKFMEKTELDFDLGCERMMKHVVYIGCCEIVEEQGS